MRWACLVAAVVLIGCGDGGGIVVRQWRLGGELATPGDVELPSRIEGVAAREGTYTLAARVAVPAEWRGATLTVVVYDVPAIVQLFADGEEALMEDVPARFAYRARGPLRWRIPPSATADGVVELAFTVQNRWTQSTWWNAAPVVVPANTLPGTASRVDFFNQYVAIAAVISLLQIGVTSALLYFANRRRRAYLWFSLQCFGSAYYPLFILGPSQLVFGIYDGPMLAAALIGTMLASVYFTHEFFEEPRPWRGWTWLCIGSALVFAVAHDPFVATHIAGPLSVAVQVILATYQINLCTRLSRTHPDRKTARLLLAAWIALILMVPFDLFYWLGHSDPLEGARPATLGLLGFGVCLSLLVGRRHLTLIERARHEVEQLNVELGRQVTERSAQLFAALALVGRPSKAAPPLASGELINGRYRVINELGRGGMGTVYEVERVADGRRLALKMTHEVTGLAMARLAREGLITSRLTHRNVVGLIDVDVAEGFLYIVMELVRGTTLKALRDRFGDPAWALPLLTQVADGLAALHAGGVVHRDLKPANLLLTEDEDRNPVVKITDFGVARYVPGVMADVPPSNSGVETANRAVAAAEVIATVAPAHEGRDASDEVQTVAVDRHCTPPTEGAKRAGSSSELTRAGMLVGTPAYIAPELVGGGQLTPAADMFAFGILAWEMLTRERPYSRPIASMRANRETITSAPSIATRWPGPPAVVAALDRCLALEPSARPSAAEIAAALRAYECR